MSLVLRSPSLLGLSWSLILPSIALITVHPQPTLSPAEGHGGLSSEDKIDTSPHHGSGAAIMHSAQGLEGSRTFTATWDQRLRLS